MLRCAESNLCLPLFRFSPVVEEGSLRIQWNANSLNHWSKWQCPRWEDANYSGRKIRSFTHHTIQGGLPELGGPVCFALRISESELWSLQTGYWSSLEVSAANDLNFLVGGGDTDKAFPLLCVCIPMTLHFGSSESVRGNKEIITHLIANSQKETTCRLLGRNSMYISPVKLTSIASLERKYWCWQSLDVACTMT